MEEELISFETAKLIKELELDVPTDKYWCNYYIGEPPAKWKLLSTEDLNGAPYSKMFEFPAPTQSLLQKWLREKYHIYAMAHPVIYTGDLKPTYYQAIVQNLSINGLSYNRFDTWEKATEAALLHSLTKIKEGEYGRASN